MDRGKGQSVCVCVRVCVCVWKGEQHTEEERGRKAGDAIDWQHDWMALTNETMSGRV